MTVAIPSNSMVLGSIQTFICQGCFLLLYQLLAWLFMLGLVIVKNYRPHWTNSFQM